MKDKLIDVIRKLVKQPESDVLVFKKSFNIDLVKGWGEMYVNMADAAYRRGSKGGVILIGVDDTGKIVGIDPRISTEEMLDFYAELSRLTKDAVKFSDVKMVEMDGKKVGLVYVPAKKRVRKEEALWQTAISDLLKQYLNDKKRASYLSELMKDYLSILGETQKEQSKKTNIPAIQNSPKASREKLTKVFAHYGYKEEEIAPYVEQLATECSRNNEMVEVLWNMCQEGVIRQDTITPIEFARRLAPALPYSTGIKPDSIIRAIKKRFGFR